MANWQRMQGTVGIFIDKPLYCKFTKESSNEKKIENRLRFDRIVVMSLWPRFLAHPVDREFHFVRCERSLTAG